MELYDPSVIKAIKSRYKFKFSKSLGQNFLTSGEAVRGIIDGAGIGPGDLVIEIGPGIGTLTQAAAEQAAKVIGIEIDSNLIEIMKFTLLDYSSVEIINANILDVDLAELIAKEYKKKEYDKTVIIGNLPYYITSPILLKLLDDNIPADNMTVMMQKEVADRVMADPGSKAYGALTLAVDYYAEASLVELVGRELFMPQPKVDSAVVRLDLREKPLVDVCDRDLYFRCIKSAFSQRRKTLRNSLRVTGVPQDVINEVLEEAGIDGKRRAETLSPQDFAAISDGFYKRGYFGK
ncbi:MAG: 16S rRNA (adenine(1518)-N(6)/adenine(1519)-N(6))-dimethyltransferase RsmA [Anaerovoracaceae bacterium]